MKKLVSTNEASKLLGISVQGVHYRIKKQLLNAVKKDGKTFVYINNTDIVQSTPQAPVFDTGLLKSKDEQIQLLKDTMKWMKKQYKQEIRRLDNNQTKIIDVFKSEVTLLQQAYNEMQNVYQVEHKKEQTKNEKIQTDYISVKEFFSRMKKYNKTTNEIKDIIIRRIKFNDERFEYNSKTKVILIHDNDFKDLQ